MSSKFVTCIRVAPERVEKIIRGFIEGVDEIVKEEIDKGSFSSISEARDFSKGLIMFLVGRILLLEIERDNMAVEMTAEKMEKRLSDSSSS